MTTLLRRSTTGLVAAALAGSLVAFAPAPAPAAPAPTVPAVDAVLTADGTWVRTVAGMSDRFGFAPGDDLRDPMTWFERSRRISAANGLETVSAVDGECVDGCEEAGAILDVVVETWSYSTPTADLDGDGTDEVLVMEATFSEESVTSTTTARSGADGSVLWSSTDGGLAFVGSIPDLDGDGMTDLVGGFWGFGIADGYGCMTPLGLSCTSSADMTEVLSITAFRGVDAAEIGSYAVEGSAVFEYEDTTIGTPTGRTGREELRVTIDNGFFGLGVIDLDGDGTVQFVHETYDATFTQRVDGTINDTPLGYADAVLVDTTEDLGGTIELVDIAAGTSQTLVAFDNAIPFGQAVGGADGDRLLVDLLPDAGTVRQGCLVVDPLVADCRDDLPGTAPNEATATRTLYGADLEKVWEVPLSETSFWVFGAGADLDGDGVEDLLEFGYDADTWEDTIAAVSGATGEMLWTTPASVLVADGDRMVGARMSFMEDVAVDGLVVDPMTGAVISERRLVEQSFDEPDEGQEIIMSGYVGLMVTPLTAGSLDLVAESGMSTYAVEEYCETWEDPDGTTYEECWWEAGEELSSEAEMVGVEGADLTELFRMDDPSLLLLDVGEYDGDDSTAELIVLEVEDAGWFSFGGTVRALRLDTSTLWELADPLFASGPVHNADGTVDVLVDDDEAATISVRDGRDLATRWSISI